MSEVVDLETTEAELLASSIRRQIVTGELSIGTHLPAEAELRERYEVSRATLRAALRILESEGLVRVHRGARGGVEVTHPEIDTAARYFGMVLQTRQASLSDFQEARSALEPPLARLLTVRAASEPSVVEELEGALEAERLEMPGARDASLDFHATVARLSGSSSLMVVMDLLDSTIRHLTEAELKSQPRRGRKGHRAHAELIALVRAGDADGAERHWAAHVDDIGVRLLKHSRGHSLSLFE